MSENNGNNIDDIILEIDMDDTTSARTAEAYAVGKRGGVDVGVDDPAYHNNAKYYAEQAGDDAGTAAASATAAETAQGKAEDAQAAAETAQGKTEDAQAAAEAAQTAAETAQGKAETAQGKAEDAQSAAETAQGKAETAQGKAEDAQTAAETAQGKAEDAQTAAEAAQTAAETAQGKAEDAQEAAETAQGKAEDAQEAAEDVKDYLDLHYTNLAADVTDLKTAKAPCVYESSSGAIASFTDGADGMPMRSVEVAIEPVQDLHGYDSPWPAGGNKNLFNLLNLSQAITVDETEQSFTSPTGGYNRDIYTGSTGGDTVVNSDYFDKLLHLQAGTYCISYTASVSTSIHVKTVDSTTGAVTELKNATSGNTFTLSADAMVTLRIDVNGVKITKLQIESGSSATSYAPYSNICPISGHSSMTVTRTGRNLLNLVESEMESSGWNRRFPISVNSGSYILSCTNAFGVGTTYGARVSLCDSSNNTVILLTSGYDFGKDNNTLVGTPVTITEAQAMSIAKIMLEPRASGLTYANIMAGNLQFQVGSTALPYQAYTAQSVQIPLGQTVYGGTLDVVSGKLTIDRGIIQDMSSLTWVRATQNMFYSNYLNDIAVFPANNNQSGDIISSSYQTFPFLGLQDNNNDGVALRYDDKTLRVKNMAVDTVEDIVTALAGVQLVYRLATPLAPIDLTPQELETLLGVNNVFSDSGDVSVEYPADTKLYIDRKITEAIANALNA